MPNPVPDPVPNVMPDVMPLAHLGVILSAGNRTVETYFRVFGPERLGILINPYGDDALARERTYLEAVGFTVTHAVGLGLGERPGAVPPADWVAAACEHDRAEADGIFLSGSNTRILEAVTAIERALGKPAVTSIQAALWTGVRRLAPKLGEVTSPADPAVLGRLFEVA